MGTDQTDQANQTDKNAGKELIEIRGKSEEIDELKNLESVIRGMFKVYDVEIGKDYVRFYVVDLDPVLVNAMASRAENWDVIHGERLGEQYIEIRKKKPEKNRVWLNVLLLVLTFLSTTFVGMGFYQHNRILGGITFSIAILFVLGSHEMGHYFTAKRWKVKTSLPYFIPAPTIIGTFGAVIKQKGVCPNRNALFDIGVSGPLVGIVASIIVTYIGFKLPSVNVHGQENIIIGTPLLFDAIAKIAGFNGKYMHPVAFAGWVGMFVTCMNMIPVGQLDGGHVLRAMIGRASDNVSKIMPLLLIGLGYLSDYYYGQGAGTVWIFWGLFVMLFSFFPHPPPLDDVTPLDKKRFVLGIFAFVIAALCFTPAPFILK